MSVEESIEFGVAILVVSLAVLIALVGNRISHLIRIPAPAVLLIGAALASDIWPALGQVSAELNGKIVTVALVVILFDGGMNLGWRRLRPSLGPVLWIGVMGTVVTAAGLAAAAQWIFGLEWRTALLLGTALSPTDPAVVFSVLSGREVAGRSGTILEGESGANDPVGIALLISILGATGGGLSAGLTALGEFVLQMSVGLAVGLLGGLGLRWVVRRVRLFSEQLHPILVVAAAAGIYGLATLGRGSGFLAVFLAGILLGDAEMQFKNEVQRFTGALASLGEMVAFTILGLSVPLLAVLASTDALIGLAIAALLIFAVRPLLVGVLLIPVRLRMPERLFILWAGLKGAVPILLGVYVLGADLPNADRLYRIIFVVVLISVVLQGGTVPLAAALLRIPMRDAEPQHPSAAEPRSPTAPHGLYRYTVTAGSPADGAEVADLGLGDRTWLSLIRQDGELLPLRRGTRLHPGDQVVAQSDSDVDLERLFHRPQ